MIISDVVRFLSDLKKKHGDLPVEGFIKVETEMEYLGFDKKGEIVTRPIKGGEPKCVKLQEREY